MFSLLRNRFGIPGVISVIALVFAMFGGAYAANSSGGGKATASAKAKKGPRGPKGATGPAGPAGPQGPAGSNGAKGDTGAKGDKGDPGNAGSPGAPGAAGKSVTVEEIPLEEIECEELGGAWVKEEGGGEEIEVCNGKEGEPWTDGGTLPKDATETGGWAFNAAEGAGEVLTPISFTIPLKAALDESHVHFASEAGFSTVCTGAIEEPTAPSGHLCVYNNTAFGGLANATFNLITGLNFSGAKEASNAGALLYFTVTGEPAFGYGSWAVTG
jgi:hypothetical protein